MQHPLVKEILLSKEEIETRVKELGKEVSDYYKSQQVKDNTVILVGLLKGCVPFMAKFIENFDYQCQTEYMKVSSYEGTTQSTGKVNVLLDLGVSIEEKTVLLVEDIIDTGLTVQYVKEYLLARKPKDVKIIALVDKPEGRKVEVNLDWCGFSIPNKFVVGCGLDYDERLRNLPYIAVCDTDKLDDWKW
ncbi:hypoxanthine-guanine phosphoribosyltransferase [Spiroplasma gladiatoris]|uniref:Hypoxanthine phosphoribosyltransferase n=1 Tax=Spiroplasma gladiatoris TaxID=2143 RepID=A0A4P7AH33_9MOLU|nr:hypoxanthine phosphoribosyltransferase [Spiroplasma gladiatoris]QBQ07421.1 hypoxanthine-guanine phosphoribosyltransferase [Spiroplasma gladiatoris]